MKDLLKVGQVLDRSEMKKVMAGSGDYWCRTCCPENNGVDDWTGCTACVGRGLENCASGMSDRECPGC